MNRWLRSFKTPWAQRAFRGKRAEALARNFLAAQGYEIVEQNVRYPIGEIDLVARERGTLCFIEVRSTGSREWGGPLASITDRKRRHLIKAAQWYLHYTRQQPQECRFDVVAIDWQAGTAPSIELVRGAFTAD